MQRMRNHVVFIPRWYIYNKIPTPQTQGTLQKGKGKDYKSQMTRVTIV